MDINEIKEVAIKARTIFEQHHDRISKIHFGSFPTGSCGSSSDLLAQYLLSKGVKKIKYVHGKRGRHSHGWLEIDGLIIDIAGDQFDDGVDGVYISTDRYFHDKFSPLKYNDKPGVPAVLMDPYNKFKTLMEENALS